MRRRPAAWRLVGEPSSAAVRAQAGSQRIEQARGRADQPCAQRPAPLATARCDPSKLPIASPTSSPSQAPRPACPPRRRQSKSRGAGQRRRASARAAGTGAMAAPSRAYDGLYGAWGVPRTCSWAPGPHTGRLPRLPADVNCVVSGARDFYAQQAGFLVQKLPAHDNLFSELAHYPAAGVRCGAARRAARVCAATPQQRVRMRAASSLPLCLQRPPRALPGAGLGGARPCGCAGGALCAPGRMRDLARFKRVQPLQRPRR